MLTYALSLSKPLEVDSDLWDNLFKLWLKECQPELMGLVVINFPKRAEMAELGARHAAKLEATDVLSFKYDPPLIDQQGTAVVAEILICPAVARSTAKRLNAAVSDELATLFVHGLVHLADLDHQTPEEQRRFETVCHAIMKQGGLQPVNLWSV